MHGLGGVVVEVFEEGRGQPWRGFGELVLEKKGQERECWLGKKKKEIGK